MARKWTVGATGFALLATTFVVVACSSKEGDDDDSGNNTAAKGGTSTTGGSAGKASGGATTGGTSGTGTGGTGGSSGGMGGTISTGGMAGTAVQGGAAGSVSGAGGGAAAMGPYACKGSKATCDTYSDFGIGTAAWWGSGDFNGGFSVFKPDGKMLARDEADTTKVHITGTVDGYGFGFNFWFTFCSDLSAFTGVQFTLSGTAMAAAPLTPDSIDFQPQTNSDYPWQPRPADNKGACTSPTPTNPWSDCVAPGKRITLAATPQMILWADAGLANGKPTPFDPAASPKEIVGIQFQFPWDSTATAYPVDVTLDDLSFIGGTAVSCGTMVTGMGGMGGTGSGGMAGAPAGGQAGATGGQAGASGGQAGGGGVAGATGGQGGIGAGAGGRGGAAGGAGRGGRGGGAGAN